MSDKAVQGGQSALAAAMREQHTAEWNSTADEAYLRMRNRHCDYCRQQWPCPTIETVNRIEPLSDAD